MNLLNNGLLDRGVDLLGHDALADVTEESGVVRTQVLEEGSLPLGDIVDGDTTEKTVDTGARKTEDCE